MKLVQMACFAVLITYTVVLLCVEWNTSQDYVRNYLSDIEGPVPFYGVNTTLSVALLWGTALLFAVCATCISDAPDSWTLRLFFLSQLAVFAYLGLDDRFKLHERVAWRLGIPDHYILIVVALIEVTMLATVGRKVLKGRAGTCLLIASALFGFMLYVDACLPHDMRMRLSIEDLAKTWASFFFFLFAWYVFRQCLHQFQSSVPVEAEARRPFEPRT